MGQCVEEGCLVFGGFTLTAGKILPSHDLCPETFRRAWTMDKEEMMELQSNGGELPSMQAVQWIIVIVEGWNVEFF